MPADFRVEGVERVPLYATATQETRVAVAPGATSLRGELEVLAGDFWLCIDLAVSHPLYIPNKRECCWVHAGETCSPPPLAWTGLKHTCTVGRALDLQWERPFARTGEVAYQVQMRPLDDKEQWETLWHGLVGEEKGSQRVEVTLEWPSDSTSVELRIQASLGSATVTSGASRVHCSPEHAGAAAAGVGAGFGLGCAESRAESLRHMEHYQTRKPPDLSQRHIALRQPAAPAATGSERSGPIQRVVVMGLYHSCSSAMALELQRRFGLTVINRLVTNSRERLWKHRVHRQRFEGLREGTLAILMVKDPFFWLQSLSRNFYEVHPVALTGGSGVGQGYQDLPSRGFKELFDCLEHDKTIYPDAACLWQDAVLSYYDCEVYSATATALVRAEDFLFNFEGVMQELAAVYGLQAQASEESTPSPRQKAMKSGARSRAEALAFYSKPENRTKGFSTEQREQVRTRVDPELLEALGYGENAVSEWAA